MDLLFYVETLRTKALFVCFDQLYAIGVVFAFQNDALISGFLCIRTATAYWLASLNANLLFLFLYRHEECMGMRGTTTDESAEKKKTITGTNRRGH